MSVPGELEGCQSSLGAREPCSSPLSIPGRCGDASFWAATQKSDKAVVVSVEARGRSQTKQSTIPLSIPDDSVTVRVLYGKQLTRNFCTDVIFSPSQPKEEQSAIAGSGVIVLDPPKPSVNSSCGRTGGTLTLDGLVAKDGTRFAPITVTTRSIGCYAG